MSSGRLKMPAGMVPLMKFFVIRILVNELQDPSCSGRGPKKEFSIRTRVCNLPVINANSC